MNYKSGGKPSEFLDFQEDILKECLNSDFIHFDFENRYSPRRRDNFNGTITKSERGIQS